MNLYVSQRNIFILDEPIRALVFAHQFMNPRRSHLRCEILQKKISRKIVVDYHDCDIVALYIDVDDDDEFRVVKLPFQVIPDMIRNPGCLV